MNLKKWQARVHALAVEKGWWESENCFSQQIANFHDEISEAWQEWVKGHPIDEIRYVYSGLRCHVMSVSGVWVISEGPDKGQAVTPELARKYGGTAKPLGIPIELADAVIRIMDACESAGIDLEEAIRIKHEFNITRPYRHGGKRA